MAFPSFLDVLTPDELVQRLELALDGADVGIWDWDLRTDQVQFDRRWCEMLGLDHATTPMAIDTWSSRVHPDDLAGCFADIRAHLDGRTSRYQNVHRIRHADGRWLHILDRGRVAAWGPDGAPVRFTGTHSDVTPLEHAKELLADQQRQLVHVLSHLPVGVALLDRQLRVQSVNHRFAALFGDGDPTTFVGRAASTLPGPPSGWEGAARLALAGEVSAHAEEEWRAPGAPSRWVRWDLRPFRTALGDVDGALLSVEDVSATVRERRAAEAEREARKSALAVFAGELAHELNTPLQVVLSEAEACRRLLGVPGAEAKLHDAVEALAATAARTAAIARALRTLARDARRDPPVEVAAATIVADAGVLCAGHLSSRGVGLTIDPVAPEARVVARPSELLHALLAMVKLAGERAAAGGPGGRIRLEVRAEPRTVRFCVSVSAGRGLDPEGLLAADQGLLAESVSSGGWALEPDADRAAIALVVRSAVFGGAP